MSLVSSTVVVLGKVIMQQDSSPILAARLVSPEHSPMLPLSRHAMIVPRGRRPPVQDPQTAPIAVQRLILRMDHRALPSPYSSTVFNVRTTAKGSAVNKSPNAKKAIIATWEYNSSATLDSTVTLLD